MENKLLEDLASVLKVRTYRQWPVVAQARLGFLLVEAAYFQKLKGWELAPGSDLALPLWYARSLL